MRTNIVNMDIKESKKHPRNVALELLQAWQKLRRRGDGQEMAKDLEYSRPVIDRALNFGHVNVPGMVDSINQWFTERLTRERKSANKLLQLNIENESTNESV